MEVVEGYEFENLDKNSIFINERVLPKKRRLLV